MAPSREHTIILYSAHYMSALHERWPKGLVPHEILTLPGRSRPCSKTLKTLSPQYSHRQQFGKGKKTSWQGHERQQGEQQEVA